MSAAQALARVRRASYDLALVDFRMPEMTGLELLQFLKMRDSRMFVILMTAYGSLALGIEALKKGAFDYLSKPFKLDRLREKVDEALARRRQLLQEQTGALASGALDEL